MRMLALLLPLLANLEMAFAVPAPAPAPAAPLGTCWIYSCSDGYYYLVTGELMSSQSCKELGVQLDVELNWFPLTDAIPATQFLPAVFDEDHEICPGNTVPPPSPAPVPTSDESSEISSNEQLVEEAPAFDSVTSE